MKLNIKELLFKIKSKFKTLKKFKFNEKEEKDFYTYFGQIILDSLTAEKIDKEWDKALLHIAYEMV